ncbi:hypothetical protein C8R47DRAFT_996975 [Mycena vitilis]|nr:hypothetical protein C8R47DRAFT_996975 [Mycena vitilis]
MEPLVAAPASASAPHARASPPPVPASPPPVPASPPPLPASPPPVPASPPPVPASPPPVPASPSPSPPPPPPPPTISVIFPSDAPAWLSRDVTWLMQDDLGCHYNALLIALVALETKFGFDDANNGQLPAVNRPSQVWAWVRGGRGTRLKAPPVVSDPAQFAAGWNQWWDGLQPPWRERGEDGYWKVGGSWGPDDQWDPLEAPGQNGCLSVVASLFFWGRAVLSVPAAVEAWERALFDVTWMLEGLAASIQPAARRVLKPKPKPKGKGKAKT